ncbi:MAG: glycosyltransferase [Deltaproteobacteria bacterium]|nr:glycosyltransferase [Deltaproteobacteria bacterium]
MTQKLHILASFWDAAYWTTVSILQKKRSALNRAGFLYNPQCSLHWQAWSHEPLCSQFKAYLFGKKTHAEPAYLAAVDKFIMSAMQSLEDDAGSGKDVLCFLGGIHPDAVPFLIEYINKFKKMKGLQPTFTAILGRQDDELRCQFLRQYKQADAQTIASIQIEQDCRHRGDELYSNFAQWCGQENCHLITHNSADPQIAEAGAMSELTSLFGLRYEEEESPPVCFPRTCPGIDLACALKAFSFSAPTSKDQNGFYARLRKVERDEGYEEALFMPKKEAACLLERCREGNDRLSRLLGRPGLFPSPHPLDALADAPENPPDMTEQQCATFCKALDPDMKDFFLRRLRDLDRKLTPKEWRIGRCLERDRLARKTPSVFAWPRRTPVVTVLTLCYNHEKYILDCMRGVTGQQADFPVEHVIVDDCSSDNSAAIIDGYASSHPHVRPVFRPFRAPHGENIRDLFGLARSEYVALCDGDDYFTDPAKLQIQADYLDEHQDCALCFHPVRIVYEGEPDKERVYPPADELPRGVRPYYHISDLVKANFIQTNSVMYRWRFQGGLPDWFHPELVQGDWYWHMLHAEKGNIGFINAVMSAYRRHDGALWRLSEIDRRKHRYKVGLDELHCYHTMNEHGNGKYREHFLRLGDGVIADILSQARIAGNSGIIDEINEKYPQFAQHFMETLAAMKRSG